MNDPIIIVENLCKKYKNAEEYSLQNVTITISRGDKFGILGPNGAGKTTLISILCGITNSTHGTFKFLYPNSIHSKYSQIGFVPQDFALFEELTANQNLEYFGALYNLSRDIIKSQSIKLLELLGLSKVGDKKVKTFSGGMKRRLNLAIGIIHNPEIIFLDEPTVGVDIQSKNAIMSFLEHLNSQGTTIIYTSHHLSEAEHFCNTIAILDYGKLIACNSIENLKQLHDVESLNEIILKLTGEGYRDNV